MKKERDNKGFQGFVLLESSISLSILCLVMLSVLPLIAQMKEQTVKSQQNTDATRLLYESSQMLMSQTDSLVTTIKNDSGDYHINGTMSEGKRAEIVITLSSVDKQWVIYEK